MLGQKFYKRVALLNRPAIGPPVAGFLYPFNAAIQQNNHNYSSGSTSDLTKYKRGRGGRSSFNGIVCTIFGASGFIGSRVVNNLAKQGSQMIITFREDPVSVRRCKLLGDLGQIITLPFNIEDTESVRRAIKYSNVVINLIGRERESINYSYDDVHVKWPRHLARICKEMGIPTLLHMSSLNAVENVPSIFIKGGSRFLKSKYEGEVAVREEFPDAIIFKCSDMFGVGDRFFRYYSSLWRPLIPFTALTELYKKGTETEKQPVFVNDVTRGITAAVTNPKLSKGQTYEIVGPYRYKQADLVDFFNICMKRDTGDYGKTIFSRYKRIEPTPLMSIKCTIADKLHFLPWHPFRVCYWEKFEREALSDATTYLALGLEDLGITDLKNVEDEAIYQYRQVRASPKVYDSGIIDPLDLEGRYPPRIKVRHVEHV